MIILTNIQCSFVQKSLDILAPYLKRLNEKIVEILLFISPNPFISGYYVNDSYQ